MNTLSVSQVVSKEIFNSSQKFTNHLGKYQQGNFREIIRGMITTGSSYLSQIAKANNHTNNVRKDVERYSNTLSKVPTEDFQQIHINSHISQYKSEPLLILSDGGDIQKPNAKKMELVCQNVDGSNNHKVGKGFPLQSLVAYGVNTQNISPLACHVFSNQAEDYKGDWDEHRKVFNMISPLVKSSSHDRIIVEDRGCDDEKRFLYFLNELQCSFVTRICAGNKSRNIIIKNEDQEAIKTSIQALTKTLKNKAEDKKTWFNKKLGKKLTSQITFQKVFLPKHKNTPLYAIFVYSEGYDEPLVVLTDLTTKNSKDAWKHFFYYKKRWEVENFYRAIKQSFGAEKFLILSFKKIQALIFLIMISMAFLLKIKQKSQEFFGSLFQFFTFFCKREQRTANHHLDVLAFLRSCLSSLDSDHSYRFYSLLRAKDRYTETLDTLPLDFSEERW